MESIVDALHDMRTAMRTDQNIYKYYQKYCDLREQKNTCQTSKKVQEYIRQHNLVQEQAEQYNIDAVLKKPQNTLISPEKETQEAVLQLKKEFAKHGVDLQVEWQRITNQSAKSNVFSWHLGEKPLNLAVIRRKLYVIFGSTNIEIMNYLSSYLK